METALSEPEKQTPWDQWRDLDPKHSLFTRPDMTAPEPETKAEATPDGEVSVGSIGQAVSLYSGGLVRQDWSNALTMVERAARLIHDYEQKFTSIERDARQFLRRVEEDQERYRQQIANLEMKLAQTEERLKAVSADNWEKKNKIQELQNALRVAEDELDHSSQYIRKVESLLGGL